MTLLQLPWPEYETRLNADPESENKLDLWDDPMASALQETLEAPAETRVIAVPSRSTAQRTFRRRRAREGLVGK